MKTEESARLRRMQVWMSPREVERYAAMSASSSFGRLDNPAIFLVDVELLLVKVIS